MRHGGTRAENSTKKRKSLTTYKLRAIAPSQTRRRSCRNVGQRKILGLGQGLMEFGPRALAPVHPRRSARSGMNAKGTRGEISRMVAPIPPSMLAEVAGEYIESAPIRLS